MVKASPRPRNEIRAVKTEVVRKSNGRKTVGVRVPPLAHQSVCTAMYRRIFVCILGFYLIVCKNIMVVKILFIAYYFPPAGGSGVQRSAKFVKYLPEFGCLPIVLTVAEASAAYPELDPNLGQEIDAQIPIYRTKAFNPFALKAKLTGQKKVEMPIGGAGKPKNVKSYIEAWIRANLFIPDARKGWVKYALQKAEALIQEFQPDVIYTTGPPHSTHLIGKKLKAKYKLPWVADFRDPWTEINYYEDLPHLKIVKKIDKRLEKSVLEQADVIVTVSDALVDLLQSKVENPQKIKLIQNGFDLVLSENQPQAIDNRIFSLRYVGSLYDLRNPQILWQALSELRLPNFEVLVVGKVSEGVLSQIEAYGLKKVVKLAGYVPHNEAATLMDGATALLLVIDQISMSNNIMPGKMYEYLATGRPILGLGNPDGNAAELLNRLEGGKMFGHEDVEGLKQYLSTLYQQWELGNLATQNRADALKPYSRKAQAETLAKIFKQLA